MSAIDVNNLLKHLKLKQIIETFCKISYWPCILCAAISNVSRVTLITGQLQKIDLRKLSKTCVSKAPDMSLTKNSNQGFLPWGATNS